MIKLSTVSRLIYFLLFTVLISCGPSADLDQEREKILATISSMREAHFESDAEKFLEPMLDSFLEVRSGRYMKLLKKESLPGIQSYFDNMEFLELEDVQESVVEISDDASMATYTGSIILKGSLDDSPIFSKLSWLSTLKKIDGQWKIIQNVNTSMPNSNLGPVVMDRVKSQFANMPDSLIILAKAACTGPTDPFETLVLSGRSTGRMEQLSSDGHLILQHGDQGSWMFKPETEELSEGLEEGIVAFVIGHEFHRIALRPEDRFTKPTLKEITEYRGQEAFEMVFKDPLEREIFIYYSFDNYLPLGFKYPSHVEGQMIDSHFLNWTEINGIPVFQKAVIDENGNLWEYEFNEINFLNETEVRLENKEARITKQASS